MNILAIGAHPDDIEFGCGGTLIKYARKGHNVFLLVLTMGSVGGDPGLRKREQEEAVKFMKARRVFWGNFQDTEIPLSKELISVIEDAVNEAKPHTVFFNYLDDIHQDHRILAQAAVSATRYLKEVLYYEVPTTQNFEPDVFVNITDALDKKLELLKLHASQVDKTRVEDLTILESARSCANFRGYQGRVKYAEGFKALRILKDI
ncbi:MAG TPA: PIG-L family deacetylase [Nitrospirae bacterium]|nr:1D-myo-inositol 2-acetamido-2-deoxy-alpha-D-glucopyranoside deacetylase [bacterium BMS3Abin06]HDH11667.1 PIG-L family deacetylase [Nitrospirota bacterium]HDZ02087.1 PIG-L family deacetylase [Nitrospirota bacterium]